MNGSWYGTGQVVWAGGQGVLAAAYSGSVTLWWGLQCNIPTQTDAGNV